MARYGYILLDRADPDVSRQAQQLDSIGEFAKILIDRLAPENGQAGNARVQRQRLINSLQSGDVIYTAALDRWCDNLKDFLEINQAIDQVGADLCILTESLDTRSPSGRQVIRLLHGFERLEFLYQSSRKKAGIEAARRNGRRIGRPLAAIPPGFRKICREWSEGRISGLEAARQSGLGNTSFYKKAAELGFTPAKRRHGLRGGKRQDPEKQ
jgi:DNA invertase Pin-like site-specific DNA recombinase